MAGKKVHKAVGKLAQLLAPLRGLKLDDKNANKHSEAQIHKLMAALDQFGQRRPIVVNQSEKKRIIAGNGVFLAMKRLGWTHGAVLFVDDDPKTATGYAISDNQLAKLGQVDEEVLAELLREVADVPEIISSVGFTTDEISALCAPEDDLETQELDMRRLLGGEMPDGSAITTPSLPSSGDEPPKKEASHVRMVNLFLNTDNIVQFQDMIDQVGEWHGTKNVTDAVWKALELFCQGKE